MAVISLRRMSLGSGYRYLMESVALGDGAPAHSSDLTRYYAESGAPPGVFLGAGLAGLDDGSGIEHGSQVTEQHLFNLLGMCADPVTGKALGRQPNRAHLSFSKRVAQRVAGLPTMYTNAQRAAETAGIEAEERARGGTFRAPVAGFDLTFSPSKSVSVAWALADRDTKAQIYACHRQAIEVVLIYAEREILHSRSGTNGVVQEDIEGVVATAFTHWDSRAGDPQLHDHVVVANRAQSVSDGAWRTLDSRGLYKSVVALSEMHQGVLSDLLTERLGWGWDGRSRRHSERLRWEVTGVSEALMAEFSQRSVAIEERKTALLGEFVAAFGRQPTTAQVLELRRRATLETRPAKEHHSLAKMTGGWRRRAQPYVGDESISWVGELANRNDLPLLRAGDLGDGILSDAAGVAVEQVAERRATFSRANVLAEVHRQLHGVRFASPDERIAVAERTAELALGQALLISAPELHHTPEALRRADGTSRFRAKGHEVYTTTTLLEAEARLLDAGRQFGAPAVTARTVAIVTRANLPRRDHTLSPDQIRAIEQIATSGRRLDVLIGPAGTGKSTTMAGLRGAWEAEHGAGSVLGLAPSAAAAEVLAAELGIETENTAKWLFEHRREAQRLGEVRELRNALRSLPEGSSARGPLCRRINATEVEIARWHLREDQLVIVDEASLAGTFALDELVDAAARAGAKVVLVGDQGQLSAVEAGGVFGALVRDRDGLAPELTDVRRFHHAWEKRASVELRRGSLDAMDAYLANERIADGDRDQMLDALYLAWKDDTESGQTSLMIAGDLRTVSELNDRARGDRVAAGEVSEHGLSVAGGGTAGVGDLVISRQNDRRLSTGQRWVRNGDRWVVTATHQDGTMTAQRANGGGTVNLPTTYVSEHLELAYASSAHRAQGRTVDTAHALVSSTTTREVLYVMATRGRASNRLYVDTHYDPDPQTSHDQANEVVTAKDVLAGVLRNEGADVAAHDIIGRQLADAEGMERLSAEYLTLAMFAQQDRWDSLLARSGLSEADLTTVRASAAYGPLLAAFRDAEARGLDVETTLPRLVAGRSLADAADVAAVLHSRVERWTQAASGRNRQADKLIAGLIPRAQRVSDPELTQALNDREQAMEGRARSLADQALESGERWVQVLGTAPTSPGRRDRWMKEISTIAAYRDRWHVDGQNPVGRPSSTISIEQTGQRQRAVSAVARAAAISSSALEHQGSLSAELVVEVREGVEL
jgi:conjugative relaxase-like TrwC/TraI family protein